MNYTLAFAIGGLAAFGCSAQAQLTQLYPGQLDTPAAAAERVGPLESGTGLTLDGRSISQLAGDISNPLFQFGVDPGTRVIGLDWSLLIEASSPALLSDLKIAIYGLDSEGSPTRGVLIGPGDGINFSGSFRVEDEWLGLSNDQGYLDLAGLGLDFAPGVDNTVYLELFTEYPGATISLGTGSRITLLTESVPSPAAPALVGVFGLVASRRRRR